MKIVRLMSGWRSSWLPALVIIASGSYAWSGDATKVPLRFAVQDGQGHDLACRIHVWDAEGRPQRAADVPYWHDHFAAPGRAELQLAPGQYKYLIERGPEYERRSGQVAVDGNSPATVQLNLARLVQLRQQGWYCADLHIHRPIEHAELLIKAEDLDLAPVITWWNARNLWSDRELPGELWQRTDDGRFLNLTAGEDEREGGALLYFGLRRPVEIAGASREFPSPLEFVDQARVQQPSVWIDVEKPFWWDVPTWLASGQVQSIGLANNHMCRDQMLADEAWGRPRDVQRLPAPRGNGFYSQEIYYHVLNAGLRIPPSAGSASGVLPNPVGYNRVYVHLDEPFGVDAWWQGLREGRCFVTNGPLLICQADGKWPGSVITPVDFQTPVVRLSIWLMSRDPIERLEVIQNGAVVKRLETKGLGQQSLECEVPMGDGGWFLVRAIADDPRTFRFASTGPFYVERQRNEPRVSRASVEFFQEWVRQRIERVKANLPDDRQRAQVLRHHEAALRIWQQRLAAAK
jgi:hypothetical protein